MFARAGLVSVSAFVALAASLPNPFLEQRDALTIGFTTSTSFTQYSGCNIVACGSVGGGLRNAAVSESIFQLSACGTCWALTPNADMNGQPISGAHPITVRVNNECPATDERCSQQGLQGTNSLGMHANFDLCLDDGTADALFGKDNPVRLLTGTATLVNC